MLFLLWCPSAQKLEKCSVGAVLVDHLFACFTHCVFCLRGFRHQFFWCHRNHHFLQKTKSYLGDLNPFWNLPNIFWLNDSDSFGIFIIFLGTLLSLIVMMGFANFFILLSLWVIQLSIYHVGQTFWGFGWEMNRVASREDSRTK